MMTRNHIVVIVGVVKLTQITHTCLPARMATLQQDTNQNELHIYIYLFWGLCLHFSFQKAKTTNIALDYYPEVEESPYRTSISCGKSLIMVSFICSIVSLGIS